MIIEGPNNDSYCPAKCPALSRPAGQVEDSIYVLSCRPPGQRDTGRQDGPVGPAFNQFFLTISDKITA